MQSKSTRWATIQAVTNNSALFDAALAAIADSNGAWITSPATGSYVAQANAAVAVATEIDAAIPAVPGGATISQRNLLVAITKSVMEGRSPTNTLPATYATIALAIAGMFGEYKTRLLNNDIGSAGSSQVSRQIIIPSGTTFLAGWSQLLLTLPYDVLGDLNIETFHCIFTLLNGWDVVTVDEKLVVTFSVRRNIYAGTNEIHLLCECGGSGFVSSYDLAFNFLAILPASLLPITLP